MSLIPSRSSKLLFLVAFAYGLLSWSACDKLVDYRYDYSNDRLAVTARISPQEGFQAFVYRSAPPLGEFLVENLIIPDAEVLLFSNDTLVGMATHVGRSKYVLMPDSPIPAGSLWRMEISHPELPEVISENVTIPAEIVATQYEITDEFDFNTNETVKNLTFSTPDPAGADFYLFETYPNGQDQILPFQIRTSLDFDFQICGVNNYHPPLSLFFADFCFDGEMLSLDITIDTERPGDRLENYTRYVIRVGRLDANYWGYLNDQRNLDENSSVIEPRPSYTNLNGGVGVFMASNDLIRSFPR